MTINNDGLYIPDDVLIGRVLPWKEKIAYGYILKYSINKDRPFIDPRILAYKMQIDLKEAIILMASLKDSNMI